MLPLETILHHLKPIALRSSCCKAAKKAIKAHEHGWVDALFIIQEADERRKVKQRAAGKRYQAANLDKKKAKDRRWYLANREHKMNMTYDHINAHKATVAREYGAHCCICGSTQDVEWIHVRGNAFKKHNVSSLYTHKSDTAWRKEVAEGPCVRACRICHGHMMVRGQRSTVNLGLLLTSSRRKCAGGPPITFMVARQNLAKNTAGQAGLRSNYRFTNIPLCLPSCFLTAKR